MHLPRFTHYSPRSFEEAVKFLQEHPGATLMAGGTDLLPRMKQRLNLPQTVISLKHIPPAPPRITPEGDLLLDPLTTLNALTQSSLIREHAPMLAEAAGMVASNEIRHMATIGGNLCQQTRCLYYNQSHRFQFVTPCFKRGGDHCSLIPKGKKCWAVFMADTAPALISLGAKIKIMGPKGVRQMPLEDFYTGDAVCPLEIGASEILAEIIIPSSAGLRRGQAFTKLSLRDGLEFAALSVGVVLEINEDRTSCEKARVTVGAVSSRPKRAVNGETNLTEEPLSAALFNAVARNVAQEIKPVLHHGYSRAYLAEALRVSTEDTLARAAEGS